MEFVNTDGDAQKNLRYSQTWNRDFLSHHSNSVDKKTQQFQCIANKYWEGMYQFKYMAGPFFVYRDVLMKTNGIFGKHNLEDFLRVYRNKTDRINEKEDDVFFATNGMSDWVHHKINKSEPWGPDLRVHEFRNLMRTIVFTMSLYTFVIAFGYAPFMENLELKEILLRIFDWGQNVILVFVIVNVAMFTHLATKTAGANKVQEAILDVDIRYLNGLNSSEGLDLGALFGEAQRTNKTLIEIYFKQRYIFDARPEIFESKVKKEDFKFLDDILSIQNGSRFDNFNTSFADIINIHNFYRGVAEHLEFDTKENQSYFIGIIFGINYFRYANALMKHVLVASSSPIWSLDRFSARECERRRP